MPGKLTQPGTRAKLKVRDLVDDPAKFKNGGGPPDHRWTAPTPVSLRREAAERARQDEG